jgi:DNA-binding GntR family transcriptional regulator
VRRVATTSAKTTRAKDVYDRLRADITMARFAPGERLKSTDLCGRYGASVSVVREALAALATERFVRLQPRFGYSVAPLTEEDLRDLTEARLVIEGTALRQAVDAGDVEWSAEVVAAHHRLSFVPTPPAASDEETERWHQTHEAFHATLLSACPSRRLRESARVLRAEAELYRRWMIPLGLPREGDFAAEHQALADAAIAGAAEEAEQLIRLHIQRTTDSLIDGLRARSAVEGDQDQRAVPA